MCINWSQYKNFWLQYDYLKCNRQLVLYHSPSFALNGSVATARPMTITFTHTFWMVLSHPIPCARQSKRRTFTRRCYYNIFCQSHHCQSDHCPFSCSHPCQYDWPTEDYSLSHSQSLSSSDKSEKFCAPDSFGSFLRSRWKNALI